MPKGVKFKLATILLSFVFIAIQANASDTYTTEEFSFESSGLKLNGIISQPKHVKAKSILIIVHSYGSTNVVKGNWFAGYRKMFTDVGIAVAVWDKPGCGNSEGEFNIQQSVSSSATEVVDAVKFIRDNKMAGYQRIGLMGSSRGGWIAPLAIDQVPDIAFWISVSGTDAYETWGYLLSSSLEIAGHSKPEVDLLYQEWITGIQTIMQRGSYSDYLSATENLRKNQIYQKLTGQDYTQYKQNSKEFAEETKQYEKIQHEYLSEDYQYDKQTGLKIYVQHFDQILSKIRIPVLAILGDNDKHVDWRKTKKLYEQTMGKGENSQLQVKVFKGADHALKMSKTGGYFEVSKPGYWDLPYAEGVFKSMVDFLCANQFCVKN